MYGQWDEPKALSRDDWTESLTPCVAQLFHISHITHQGQTAALVANTKQYGLGKLGFNPKY